MTAAIKNHLVTVDAIPPIAEPTRLASELTEVVWTELSNAGLSRESVENLFASASAKTQGAGPGVKLANRSRIGEPGKQTGPP